MVKQGDIIRIDFNLVKGHEQGGHRPAVIISNNLLIANTSIIAVCPITSRENKSTAFNVLLDETTKTKGVVLCAHVKSVDLSSRKYNIVESVSNEVLDEVLDTVISLIEKSQ